MNAALWGRQWVVWLALGLTLGGSASAQEIPAIVALTIDTSGSIRPELLEQIKQLAGRVLEALPAGSQTAVFSFNDQSTVILERSTDPAAVQQAVQGLRRAGRYTALYDALYDASRYLKEAPAARKAIILVTDGLDENSSVQIEDGLRIAVESRIPVYCVGVGRIQEGVLRRIAKLTGGEYSRIAETSPAGLAQRIAELPAPASATAPPPVVAAPGPPSAAAENGRSATWMYVIAGALVVGSAFGAAYLLRKKPTPTLATSEAAAALGGEEDDRAERTLVMRSPELGPVERTVVLRLQPTLTITRGWGEGQAFRLSPDSAVSIGRAPTNDIPLDDGAVSGEHCRIRPEQGAFVLHDLQSTNGTFVNEKRTERHRLSEGDIIRVGETHLRFTMVMS